MSAGTITVVATTRSRFGGTCQRCGRHVSRGEPIVKIDVGRRGPQTSAGNGLGEWWCEACATTDAA